MGAEATDEAVMEESTVNIQPQAGNPTTEAEIDAKYRKSLKVSCGCGAMRWTAIITNGPENDSELYLIGEDVVVPSGVPLCGVGSGTWKSDQQGKEVLENEGVRVCAYGLPACVVVNGRVECVWFVCSGYSICTLLIAAN